jgi:hypothetical protein
MRARAAGLLCADIASFTPPPPPPTLPLDPDFDLLADFDFPAIVDNYEVVWLLLWLLLLLFELITL